jgi:hypothetical protein
LGNEHPIKPPEFSRTKKWLRNFAFFILIFNFPPPAGEAHQIRHRKPKNASFFASILSKAEGRVEEPQFTN